MFWLGKMLDIEFNNSICLDEFLVSNNDNSGIECTSLFFAYKKGFL